MKSVDAKDNTYIDSMELHSAELRSSKEVNDKDRKFKVGDQKFGNTKIFLQKRYTPNWSEEVFAIKIVRNSFPWTYVINDLNIGEIIGTFYEKELQKTNQQSKKNRKSNHMSNGKVMIHLIKLIKFI